MSELFIIVFAVIAVIVWVHMQSVRELALSAARRHCREVGVQFLDGSVFLDKVKVTRASSGALALAQRFKFEFTVTGARRYQGEVVFVGKRQVRMQLEPHAFFSEQ